MSTCVQRLKIEVRRLVEESRTAAETRDVLKLNEPGSLRHGLAVAATDSRHLALGLAAEALLDAMERAERVRPMLAEVGS